MNDGLLRICKLENTAQKGRMPKETLIVCGEEFYELRTVGVNRLYAARGVNAQVDLLVRIWPNEEAQVGRYVVLEGGKQYRIDAVQILENEDGLRVQDLTLIRLERNYDVDEET